MSPIQTSPTSQEDAQPSGAPFALSPQSAALTAALGAPTATPPTRIRATVVGEMRKILAQVAVWRARHRSRAELMALDERALRDIGLSREEAEAEGRKPFWRP